MFDLVLTGGCVVGPSGPGEWDVAVQGEKIAAIADRGSLTDHARRVLSVAGMIVVPGGIDPHIHCNWPVHDPMGAGLLYTAGPDVVSRAALHGGTTTLIDFVICNPGETPAEPIERTSEFWSGNCHCDFSYHILIQGRISSDVLGSISTTIDAGFPSFKIFTTNVRPRVQDRMVPFGSLADLFQTLQGMPAIVAVHAEDDDIVMHMYEKMIEAGKTHYRYMPDVHSSLSEELSFRRVIGLAKEYRTSLYMMHVSAATGVSAIADARDVGLPIYGETLHQYALHTQDDYLEPDGMKYHTYPSLKAKHDVEALWTGVGRGDIATFATDELCTTYAVKTSGARIDDVVGGNTGAEPRMAIVYTEVVCKRGLGLDTFAELTSTNAARILGLYPRKGVIAVGSDADLAVFDPNGGRQIRASDLHESDYTPWEGWRVEAWPVMTLLRGRVVVDGESFYGDLSDGKLVPRTLSASVNDGVAI